MWERDEPWILSTAAARLWALEHLSEVTHERRLQRSPVRERIAALVSGSSAGRVRATAHHRRR
jgi:hypothetical protein